MSERSITLGLVQMSMAESPEENLRKAETMIVEASSKGAKIIALPELFLGLYFCKTPKDARAFERAEEIPGKATEALGAIAKREGIVLIGGSIFERASNGKYYNTTCVFGPDGSLLGTYRKTHIPEDPGFYEQDYFAPGDTGIRVFDTPYGKICPMICYDQWFPEAARIAVLKGAELIVYPTAIGNASVPPVDPKIPENWEQHWRAAQVGHAAANCVYVAAVNRVGMEGGTRFFGGSFIANPGGQILAQGDSREGIWTATLDLAYVQKMQEAWRFLLERRPETYGDITKTE